MKEKSIGDLCKVIGGKPAPSEKSAFENGVIPFLRMRDLGAYHLTNNLIQIRDKLNSEYVKKNNLIPVKKGALLLPRSGSVGLNHRAILGVDAIIVSHICALEILNKDELDNLYLFYYMSSINMSKITKKTTGLDAITFEDLKQIKIPLPDLKTQQKIARVLEQADKALDKRTQANKLSEQFIQSVFIELFDDPLSNEKGWSLKRIGDMGIVKTGNTPPRLNKEFYGDYIEWIKTDNIKSEFMHPGNAKEHLSEKGLNVGRFVEKDSILVTCIAGSPATIGNIVLTDRKVAFNQQINSLTPSSEFDPYFVYGLFRQCKKLIQESTTKGMKRIITKSVFENIELINPPIRLQRKYAKFVGQVEKLRVMQRESEDELNNLFQSLMQKYFN